MDVETGSLRVQTRIGATLKITTHFSLVLYDYLVDPMFICLAEHCTLFWFDLYACNKL